MKSDIRTAQSCLAAVLLGIAIWPACAGDRGLSFQDYDANRNGYLSESEFKAKGKDDLTFRAADINGDEQVDPNEFDKYLMKEKAEGQRGSDSGAPRQPSPAKPPSGY